MNLIGGRWCAALDGRTYMRPNPARPDDVIGHFPDSGPADAESAAQAAARTYPAWRDLVPTARSEVLRRACEVATVMSGMLMGDGACSGVDIGPLIDARAKDKAEILLESAVGEGATVAVEGCPLAQPELAGGYFFAPRVVQLPEGPSPLRYTEAFAPIMSIVAADDVVEAGLKAITDGGMGLSASVLTTRIDLAHAFARRAEAGLVNVNLLTTGVEYQAPFGGWNQSGGPFPEAGQTALDFFTRRKTIAFSAP